MSRDRRLPLFAYGTLQFEEILISLIGRVPEMRPAIAVDNEARRLPGVGYPGLVSVSGGRAEGMLIDGLSAEDWATLDEYEDDFYELTVITTRELDGSRCRAHAYRVDPATASAAIWTREWFTETHLRAFVGEFLA